MIENNPIDHYAKDVARISGIEPSDWTQAGKDVVLKCFGEGFSERYAAAQLSRIFNGTENIQQ